MNELYCQKCRAKNPPHARFCYQCGTYIPSDAVEDGGIQGKSPFLVNTKDATIPSEEMLKTLPSKQNSAFAWEPDPFPQKLDSMPLPGTPPPSKAISFTLNNNTYSTSPHWTDEIDAVASQPTGNLQQDSRQKKGEDEDEVLPLFPLPPSNTSRANHLQAASPRAQHLQPLAPRAEHLQPTALRTGHLQPATIRTTHKQPLLQRIAHNKSLNSYPVMGGAAVVLVGVIAFLSLIVFRSNAQPLQPPAPQLAQLAAVNASGAFPGGLVTLQGRQFVPGGTITFESDQQAINAQFMASAPSSSSATSATLNLAGLASSQVQLDNQVTVVQPDGTFTAFIHIPQDWQVGTNHTIRANERTPEKSAYGVVTLTIQAASVVPAPAPAPGSSQPASKPSLQPQPVDQPASPPQAADQAPSQNSSQVIPTFTKESQDNPAQNNPPVNHPSQGNQHVPTPVCLGVDKTQLIFRTDAPEHAPDPQTLTINNDSECDSGKWYARADVPWLRAEANQRTIDAGGSVQVKLSVSPSDFKDGINTVGHLTFEPGDATVLVRLIVAPPTPCLLSVTDGLHFTLTNGDTIGVSPESQRALIGNAANCGSGQWTVSSDQPWLVAKGGGQIDPGQIVGAAVSVNPAALPAQGERSFDQYINGISGIVTFQTGSSRVRVGVKLFTPSPKIPLRCLDLQTNQLNFTGDLKNNSYYDAFYATVGITNCGDAGTLTATATNQGPNWLSVSGGGPLSANDKLSIIVKAVHPDSDYSPLLEDKDYHGTVTVTITTSDGHSQDARINVIYHVIDTRPPCPRVDSSPLTFEAFVNSNAPDAQKIKVSNTCGNGNWSITSKDPWLSVNPGGPFNSKGSVEVSVNASTAGVKEQTRKTSYLVLNPGDIEIPVTLNVKQREQPLCLTVSPTTFSFTQNTDKTITPSTQTLSVANGANCLAGTWSVTSDNPGWLNVTGGGQIAKGGSGKATLSVKNIESTTTGHIIFNPGNIVIPVTLTVQQSTKPICLTVPAPQLNFTVKVDGSVTPGPQNVSVINGAGCGAGPWSATSDSQNWLSVTGGGQMTPGGKDSITISAHAPQQSTRTTADSSSYQENIDNPGPLKPLEGHINVQAGGTTQATIKVILTFEAQVVTPTPVITPTPVVTPTPIITPTPVVTPAVAPAVCPTVNSGALTFNAVEGGTAPGTQSLTVSNGRGCGAGEWSAKSNVSWLGVSPGSGTLAANGSASLSINTSTAGLAPGGHTGHISFSPGQAIVTVTLNITSSVTPTPVVTPTTPPPTPVVTPTTPPPTPTCLTAASGAINVTLKPGTQTTQYAAAKNGGNCTAGQWTSGSDSNWILASGSGQVAAGGSANATVRITTNGLTPGKTYQGNVVFTSGSSKAVIPVTLTIAQPEIAPTVAPQPVITPTVAPRPTVAPQPTKPPVPVQPPTPVPVVLKPCVTAVPAYLSFVVTVQAGDPGSQVVTLSNCGSPGTITLRSTSQWLTATGGGFVGAGVNTAITIHAININQAGTYSGTITALITTRDGQVTSAAIGVTLKVKGNQPPPAPTQPTTPTQPPAQPTAPTAVKEQMQMPA